MSASHQKYPPLAALRAFEAAARLLNFTAAGGEIGLTQSGVSHAVRDLEARLGKPLFRRAGRAVALTDAGRLYYPFARDALERLAAGALAVAGPGRDQRLLTVSVSPSFAAKWLAPRLGVFAARHPDIELRIDATARHVNFSDGEVDLAIRHGDGGWPNLEQERLCTEEVAVMAAPALAPKGSLREKTRRIAAGPLIHFRDREGWSAWLAARGAPPEGRSRGPVLSEMSLVIDAAAAGQGFALARTALAARDLAAGRLVRPVGPGEPVPFAYWIVRPKGLPRRRALAAFRRWLLEEAAADAAAIAGR